MGHHTTWVADAAVGAVGAKRAIAVLGAWATVVAIAVGAVRHARLRALVVVICCAPLDGEVKAIIIFHVRRRAGGGGVARGAVLVCIDRILEPSARRDACAKGRCTRGVSRMVATAELVRIGAVPVLVQCVVLAIDGDAPHQQGAAARHGRRCRQDSQEHPQGHSHCHVRRPCR